MHEIITVQLGQKANYLATHFWNTQESYFTYSSDEEPTVDHDVHFRPGLGADGTETFTPRTVIYDLKGGFGSLRKINALYEIEESAMTQGLWNGPAIVQRMPPIPQNPYQQSLEDGSKLHKLTTANVKYWSDFNHVYFHPKSIVQLNEYEMNSTIMPFENWDAGVDLFKDLDKEHDLLDRDLRPFAEECDHMQGIQIMASTNDAWGGFAARYLDKIRDEYGKKTVYIWSLEDNTASLPRATRHAKSSNAAKSISEIVPQSSLYIPIVLPSRRLPSYVSIEPSSSWHVSGILCMAVETVTLPSRLRTGNNNRESLDELLNVLNVNGNQNIAKLGMIIDQKVDTNGHNSVVSESAVQYRDLRMPSQQGGSESMINDKDKEPGQYDFDLFPNEMEEQTKGESNARKAHIFGRFESIRSQEESKTNTTNLQDDNYQRAQRRAAGLPIVQKKVTPLLFPLLDSFPSILAEGNHVSHLDVSASLSTESSVAMRVKYLQQVAKRTISMEEREALSNSLGEIAEAYEEGWDGGSDSGDDD